jgi:chromate reductase
MVRLLCFAGSTREGSYNKKLARLAQHIASANGVEAVFVDLIDYPMPLYNGDLEAKDEPPIKAREFKALLGEYQGVFIASPEYNSSVTPLLKNTLDWVTRVRAKGESGLEVYRSRVFAISGASPGYYGAMRSLLHLRQILAVGVGATVIPQQLALPRAGDAFEADGSLKDEAQQKQLADVVEKLVVAARKFAAP